MAGQLATLFAGLLALSAPLWAGTGETNAGDSRRSMREFSAVDLGVFLDGVITSQLAAYQIPGAVVSVVHEGKLLFARGYGVADVRTGRPVSADRTLFRVGSVSKVFTWTAVMQLVEQRRLDLGADINGYLDGLQVPKTLSEPITLQHLLTHSAGFEDRFFGLFAPGLPSLLSLEEYLVRYMPARVRPPGQVTAYSNYGAALAGHAVSTVSGLPFEQYVAKEILEPLDMAHSSFLQPLPEELARLASIGHGKRLEPVVFEWLQPVPAGALSATAADMAKFMLMHLQRGRHAGRQVLKTNTAESMQQRQFGNDPRVAGLTYGFDEFFLNGQRILWQPGDTLTFSSAMILLPQNELGLFVAYNRLAHSQPRADFLKLFLDRYFPARLRWPPQPLSGFAERASRYEGSYMPTRANLSTAEKVFKLFKPVTVQAMPNGLLHIRGLWVLKDALWAEVEPRVFRSLNGEEMVVFRGDRDGRVELMFEGNYPASAYVRLPWYGSYGLHYALAAFSALAFLSALVLWPVCAGCGQRGVGKGARWTVGLALSMCGVNLVFGVSLLAMLTSLRRLAPELESMIGPLLVLPWLGAGLTLACAIWLPLVWKRGYWSWLMRVHYTAVVLAGLSFVAFSAYWRLLAFPS